MRRKKWAQISDGYLMGYLIYWSSSSALPTQNPINLFYVRICLLYLLLNSFTDKSWYPTFTGL